MKGFRHILLASAAILAAAACTKTVPEGPQVADMQISICASEGLTKSSLKNGTFNPTGTKSLLDQESFQKEGNRIMVYDIYTPTGSGTSQQYIKAVAGPDVPSDSPLHQPGHTWPFASYQDFTQGITTPVSYNWTPDGEHKFFGWLAKDANMPSDPNPSNSLPYNTPDGFFGGTLNLNASYRYEIPAPKNGLHHTTPQFDFLYSDIVVRDLDAAPDFSPVQLTFNHLFTAFSIGASNNTDSDITITAFELVNLYNSATAEIDFSGNEVSVTYEEYAQVYSYNASTNTPTGSQVSHDGQRLYRSLAASYTLPGGQQAMSEGRNSLGCIFTGDDVREYNLMYPQTVSQIHSDNIPTENEGNIVYPSDWMMYIRYTADGHEFEKRLNFPALPWEAGKKYHFEVTFADKMVDLKVMVNPWEYEDQEIDYSNAGVAVTDNHTLTWNVNTYNAGSDPSLRYAYIKNGMPVEGTFQLEAPMGGTWLATLTGDIDAFDIYPSSGVIDGSAAMIKVAPKPEALGLQRDFKVKVKFAVRRPDGRTISADSILQPEGTEYTIILSAN